jgi:SOS-response transcriptional repressor LexA
MSKESYIYNIDEIFQDIPGDPENCFMTIPPAIMKEIGIIEGDTVSIKKTKDNKVVIKKVTNGEHNITKADNGEE